MIPNPPVSVDGRAPYKVYNIGNNKPVTLMWLHTVRLMRFINRKSY